MAAGGYIDLFSELTRVINCHDLDQNRVTLPVEGNQLQSLHRWKLAWYESDFLARMSCQPYRHCYHKFSANKEKRQFQVCLVVIAQSKATGNWSWTNDEQHYGTSRTAVQHCLTEMQDADMQGALRLARFHPFVTAVFGLPPYAKPTSFGLAP